MKDLILALSYGYTHAQLKVFLGSLRQTGFSGDVVFFVGATDARNRQLLRSAGVQVCRFAYPYRRSYKLRNPLHRFWRFVRPLLQAGGPASVAALSAPFVNLGFLRFLLYRNYLHRHGHRYRAVFLTDLRDVCFQDSPFNSVGDGALKVYLEDTSRALGNCPNNARWLRELYGEEVLGRLSAKPIICAGTTLGGYAAVRSYLDAFVLSLREVRSVLRMGMDQGVHNFLMHGGRCPGAVFCENGSSEVLTMGLMDHERVFSSTRNGRVVDPGGCPYPVLHQFDRHPAISEMIDARYAAK